MSDKITTVLLKGEGPHSFPPIDHPTVSMTEDGMAMIQGRLPMIPGDRTQRFVHIPMTTASAMQLLVLLQQLRQAYSLPMPSGKPSERTYQ